MALIQSGRLTDTVWECRLCPPSILSLCLHTILLRSWFQTDLVSVVKQLRVCAERKFYLQEFVAVAVCRLLGSVPEGVVRVELVPVLGLGGGWKTCTPETLYVMLELNKKYEKVLGFLKHCAAVHTSNFLPLIRYSVAGSSSS